MQIQKHAIPPLLKATQAAEYLEVSLSLVYKLASENQVPYYQIDSCVRFKKEDLERYKRHRIFEQYCRQSVRSAQYLKGVCYDN